MRKMGHYKKTITATPRQLESIIRLSEALAKMEYKDIVEKSHVDESIRLMNAATMSTLTDPSSGIIDMDQVNTGMTVTMREKNLKVK